MAERSVTLRLRKRMSSIPAEPGGGGQGNSKGSTHATQKGRKLKIKKTEAGGSRNSGPLHDTHLRWMEGWASRTNACAEEPEEESAATDADARWVRADAAGVTWLRASWPKPKRPATETSGEHPCPDCCWERAESARCRTIR